MRNKMIMMTYIFLISLSAHAGNDKTCLDNAKTNFDMKRCSSISYRKADDKLNTIYKNFIKKCQKSHGKDSIVIINKLNLSQKAWVQYRDANCSLEAASMLNGSGETLIQSECLGEMTNSRTHELIKIERELLDRC